MVNMPNSGTSYIEAVVALPKPWWITAQLGIYVSPIPHWQADTALWLIAIGLESSIRGG